MRDDRHMRIAGNVALAAVLLGLVWYFTKFGIGLATGFFEGGSPRGVPQFIWTTVSYALWAISLASWWFLARSSLNGARLLYIKVALSIVGKILGIIFTSWNRAQTIAAGRAYNEHYFQALALSSTISVVFALVDIAVLAVLIHRNIGRAKWFLSMFLSTHALGLISFGLGTLCLVLLYQRGVDGAHDINASLLGASKAIGAIQYIISTAAWLLVYTESQLPAGYVEGSEPDRKRIPLLWRIFVLATPLLAFTNMSAPGRASALMLFAPAGLLGVFVDPDSANSAMPFLLAFGYIAYIATAVAILWSRTRKALLYSVAAGFLLVLLNVAGCARMLNDLHF